MKTLTEQQLREAGVGRLFRARDLDALGLGFRDLQALLSAGDVERVSRGLYRLAGSEPSEYFALAAVAARVPNAIVCLLSALGVHGIGTQLPAEVWIGIAHKARPPEIPEFRLRIVRFTGASLRYGVEPIAFEGVPARITNAARTVVDCFRFRRLVGLDAAKEALRDVLEERKATPDEILRAAEVCRARTVVTPYLEALAG
ncbi:MAG TPA: type IV toxin-antitoxin system AbiEi family antitoxin domain-containing protein [Actinomycetota bacterium]